jgi:DNA-directed RNA polymerase subunit RPC12/RpoP
MIPVSLTGFVFVYLLVFLAGIFGIWIAYEMVRRRRQIQCMQRRLQCRMCGMEFENRNDHAIPEEPGLVRCPRCGARNESSNHQLYF